MGSENLFHLLVYFFVFFFWQHMILHDLFDSLYIRYPIQFLQGSDDEVELIGVGDQDADFRLKITFFPFDMERSDVQIVLILDQMSQVLNNAYPLVDADKLQVSNKFFV